MLPAGRVRLRADRRRIFRPCAELAGSRRRVDPSAQRADLFPQEGKGRYRAAPPDVLKAALAGAEKKRQALALQARYTEQLCRFELPAEFAERLTPLLYKPDRNTLEVKALEAACAATHLSAAHLLQRCGALPSTHDYHLQKFLVEHFPGGTDFPPVELSTWDELPLAGVNAFSIDDATTTEIDDAISVEKLANGNWRIGVHIAAPRWECRATRQATKSPRSGFPPCICRDRNHHAAG